MLEHDKNILSGLLEKVKALDSKDQEIALLMFAAYAAGKAAALNVPADQQ